MRFRQPTLHIHFLDLIAFVPDSDKIIAVTPKALDTTGTPNHEPTLVFDSRSVISASEAATPLKDSPVLVKWDLNQEDLRIENTDTPIINTGPDIDVSEQLPSGYSKRFKWVTPMQDLSSHSGRVYSDVKTGVSSHVTSRFIIDKGFLHTQHFSAYPVNPPTYIHTYKFERNSNLSSLTERAIVNIVEAIVPLRTASTTIRSSNFSGGERRHVVLGGMQIDVVYVNLSSDDNHSLDHFDYFYDILDGWTGPRFLPVRINGSPNIKDSLVHSPEPDIITAIHSAVGGDPLVDPEACPQCRCSG